MPTYRLIERPTRIPVPGGKLIEEIVGRVNTQTDGFSLAHMVAPPGWSEPAQRPDFGELTVMVRGTMRIELGDGESEHKQIELSAGQALWVEPGMRVRYSNPSDQESEYYAICTPAFSPDRAHREDG